MSVSPASVTKPRTKSTVKSRSRNGCESCKKRRLRCDERYPACSSCVKKDIECNYNIKLQFKEDLEARGICFGREGVWNKSQGSKKPGTNSNDLSTIAKNHHYVDLDNLFKIQFINFFNNDLNYTNFIRPSLSSSFIPKDVLSNNQFMKTDSNQLNHALTYYIHHVSPILNPVHLNQLTHLKDNNLALNVGFDVNSMIQYGQKHHHIFYLILGIGSLYLSTSSTDKHQKEYWMNESNKYKRAGLRLLHSGRSNITSVDSLLSIMLICLYDLANNCEDIWTQRLKDFKNILSLSIEKLVVTDSFEKSIFDYVLEFFAYQEAMGRTACKDTNLFDSNFWDNDKEITVIPWMGCNKQLVGIISDITDLSFERFSDDISNDKFIMLAEGMKHRLKMAKLDNFHINNDLVEMDDELLYIPSEDYNVEEFCFLLLCEVKRLCTEVYLDCSLLNKSPTDGEVCKLINKLFKYIKFILIDNNFKWSSLLWPIFIISSEINPLDQTCEKLRQMTLEFLNILEPHSLGNVNKARDIILNVWKKRDLMVDDNKLKVNRSNRNFIGLVNDWETFISNKNYKISLA